jgi:DNA-3-methyladenine glycosylase II
MRTFTFDKPRNFRLQSAADFFAGFTPGAGMAAASAETGGLTLTFRLDRTFEAVAARLGESRTHVTVDFTGTRDEAAVRRQLARILGLEADADAWRALGARDPIVGALQAEFPGFFTAAKPSPYDAATWAVIAPRMHMKAAAAVKMAMAATHGDTLKLGDRAHVVFPSPQVLVGLAAFPGLSSEKMLRLRGVAQAALDGKLDATSLRAMGEDRALHELQKLRGVGPWAASHIYFRGAAPIDALPVVEPRVLHGLADVLGEAEVSHDAFARHAESWRPFRMWVSVLLSRHLAGTGGWRSPKLAEERARSGRALAKRTQRAQPRGGETASLFG